MAVSCVVFYTLYCCHVLTQPLRCEQSRSVSPRRTVHASPLAGGVGSAASALLRKEYYSVSEAQAEQW